MIRILAFLFGCLAGLPAFAHAPSATSDHEVVVINSPPPAVVQALGQRFGHILRDPRSGDVRVEADGEDRAWLAAQRFRFAVDDEATLSLQRSLLPLQAQRAIPGYACYRTVEETQQTVDSLVDNYPLLASAIDIGDSWRRTRNGAQGYDLVVLKLTNSTTGGTKPKMFVMSSVHAREYTPAELMTRYAEELLAGYGVDPDATWLLDHNEFHFLLQANPDGRKRAEAGNSWRKNENLDYCGSGTRPGIDLNRNFPVFWNYNNGGSSTSACSETYRGPGAASEPETQAVIEYVRSIFPDTRPGNPEDPSIPADPDTQGLFLDIHSYSQLVLWPWGHSTAPSGNADALATLGMRMAWFNGYEPQQAVGLYPTRGTTDDFAYGEMGVPSYTIELGVAFFENCTTFQNNTAPKNLQALRYAARTLHAPYRLPAGPDAYDLSVDADTVVAGEPVRLTARVDDSRYRNQQQSTPAPTTARPHHVIAGARYYIDQLPWESGAVGQPMLPGDGHFDGTSEQVWVDIDTTALAPGRHLVFVQGHDAGGEYGPPAAVFIEIKEPAPAQAVLVGRITDRVTGDGIDGARVQVGDEIVISEDGDYSFLIEPGSMSVTVSAEGYLSVPARTVTLAPEETVNLDFPLVPTSDVIFADGFHTD